MSISADLIVGRGLVLITGQIGSGKSHFSVSVINAIREQYPDLHVFSDIDGLKIDGVQISPDDWHNCPHNAIIFYDEAQKKECFSNSNKRINSDNRVTDLTTVRHEGMTIVFITQDPSFLHPALTKLIKTHYHVSNPFENDKPKVFEFNKAIRSIDDKGRYQSQASNQFTHYLDPKIFPLYKSVNDGAEHKKTRKKPKKIYYMIAFIVFMVLVGVPMMFWGVSKIYHFVKGADETAMNAGNSIATEQTTASQAQTPMGEAVTVSTQNGAVLTIRKDLYDKLLPSADYNDIVNDEMLRPAMIVQTPQGCNAFNSYGDKLNLPDDDCLLMSSDHSLIPRTRKVQQVQNLSEQSQPVQTVALN